LGITRRNRVVFGGLDVARCLAKPDIVLSIFDPLKFGNFSGFVFEGGIDEAMVVPG